MTEHVRLILFLKVPRLGQVKTRLAKRIGDAAALDAYRCVLETVLRTVRHFEEVELRFTPEEGENELKPWLRPSWRAKPQGSGDLGARLLRAFSEAFAGGASRVVVIGSDCPYLTQTDIADAWERLRSNDLVLGPSLDGGYWLIGLRQLVPELFQGIRWGTETVLSQTRHVAERLGLRYSLLRPLSDVDTADDWHAFLQSSSRE